MRQPAKNVPNYMYMYSTVLESSDVIMIHNNYRVNEKENIFRLKSSELQAL